MLLMGTLASILSVSSAQTPSVLPPTVPNELDMLYGEEDDPVDPSDDVTWYVPHKFYRIKKIIAYMPADEVTMPGFKLIFSVPNFYSELFGVSDWPNIEHTFGNIGVGYTPQSPEPEKEFNKEIRKMATCVDLYDTENDKADFESWRMKIEGESDTSYFGADF